MESHPKVMTVSYGTFSCTLEGFDDPFTTMQLVAEYFRKLASEDRYFGGEPLQPDHNALHQIAKDANPYKVDAEVTDSGITLRKAEVVDAAPDKEAIAEEPQEDTPTPIFSSRRSAAVPPVAEETVPEEDAEAEDNDDAGSFVAATVFSSRRGPLEAAENEPEHPAATLIREAEEAPEEEEAPLVAAEMAADTTDAEPETPSEAPAEPEAEDVAAELETIKSRIAEEIEDGEAAAPVADAADPAPEAQATAEPRRRLPADDIQREEEALERLLETTNSKLDTPQHARRSNALERLKAAVAATEAERRLRAGPARTERPKVQDLKVDPSEFKSRIGDVRRDHEEVVKMTRPTAKSGGKRARGTIATLILGNDQRVSSNDAAEAAAPAKKPEADAPAAVSDAGRSRQPRPALKIVRPGDEETEQATPPQGFEAFAEKIGANTLHELLEASAAYLAIVQDEPRFSQDRIVGNLGSYLSRNNVSPDATNRSLNRLMRDGRILRVKHDSYTISKSARHGYQDRLAG